MRFVGQVGVKEGALLHELIELFDIDAVSDVMNLLEIDGGFPALIDDIVGAASPSHDDRVCAFVYFTFVILEEFCVPLIALLREVCKDAFGP